MLRAFLLAPHTVTHPILPPRPGRSFGQMMSMQAAVISGRRALRAQRPFGEFGAIKRKGSIFKMVLVIKSAGQEEEHPVS